MLFSIFFENRRAPERERENEGEARKRRTKSKAYFLFPLPSPSSIFPEGWGGGGICTQATFWLLVQILDSSNQKVMGSTLIGSTFSFRATLVTDRKNILIYSPGSKFTIISPSSLRFIFSNISPNGFFL